MLDKGLKKMRHQAMEIKGEDLVIVGVTNRAITRPHLEIHTVKTIN